MLTGAGSAKLLEPWSTENSSSVVTPQSAPQIASHFAQFEPAIKTRILNSLLLLRPNLRTQLAPVLNQCVEEATADRDEWVSAIGSLMTAFTVTGKVSADPARHPQIQTCEKDLISTCTFPLRAVVAVGQGRAVVDQRSWVVLVRVCGARVVTQHPSAIVPMEFACLHTDILPPLTVPEPQAHCTWKHAPFEINTKPKPARAAVRTSASLAASYRARRSRGRGTEIGVCVPLCLSRV